jgi:hypothetical protein
MTFSLHHHPDSVSRCVFSGLFFILCSTSFCVFGLVDCPGDRFWLLLCVCVCVSSVFHSRSHTLSHSLSFSLSFFALMH